MPEENSQFNSLSEQARLINIALKYTNGDLEKAKLMASGQLNDVSIIKGRFASDSTLTYGIFVVFINYINKYIVNVSSLVMSTKSIFEKAKIFNTWKSFYSDFEMFIREEAEFNLDASGFTNHLSSSIMGYDIFSHLDREDLDGVTADVKEIIGKFLDDYRLQCQIDVEKTSSLSLELEGIAVEVPAIEAPLPEEEPALTEEDRIIAKIEEDAEYIVPGRVIVSPVRGKYIKDIKSGEAIKIIFSNRDEISLTIARMLNALTENDEYIPVKARIKAKIPTGGGGYIIYGVIAKNTLAKIIEEENVKIEMDLTQGQTNTTKSESSLLLYIALLLGLLSLTLFVILYLL